MSCLLETDSFVIGVLKCGAVWAEQLVSNAQHSLERECIDETRVSLSHDRCLPAASVDRGGLRHGTTRHHCRGELWHDYYGYPGNPRPCGSIARRSVQRTGTCRHLANWWEGGAGLCRKRNLTDDDERTSKFQCRLSVRHCLLAGHDTGAVTRACPALGVGASFASSGRKRELMPRTEWQRVETGW